MKMTKGLFLTLTINAFQVASSCVCNPKNGFPDTVCSGFSKRLDYKGNEIGRCENGDCQNAVISGCHSVNCLQGSTGGTCDRTDINVLHSGGVGCYGLTCKDATIIAEKGLISCYEGACKHAITIAEHGTTWCVGNDACSQAVVEASVVRCGPGGCNGESGGSKYTNIRAIDTINCDGHESCNWAKLRAMQKISCFGRNACSRANMDEAKEVECSGEKSCSQSTTFRNTGSLECSGVASCKQSSMVAESVHCIAERSCVDTAFVSRCFLCDDVEGACLGELDKCLWKMNYGDGFVDCLAEQVTSVCHTDPPTTSPTKPPTKSPVNLVEVKSSAMKGDPHLQTWSNTWFDYHGECDLLYYHVASFLKKGISLTITVRTKLRRAYSYIEGAAVNIGNDTLEVVSFGGHAYNGVDGSAFHGMELAGYPIKYSNPNAKQHSYDIVIDEKVGTAISITTFKDLVGVQIKNGTKAQFGNGYGILGSWDGQFLARDGVTILEDKNAFGQEWQVHDDEPILFRHARAPQYPEEKCKLPNLDATATHRRLGEAKVSAEEAEEACAHLSGEQQKNCEMDVMLIGDVDIATSGVY